MFIMIVEIWTYNIENRIATFLELNEAERSSLLHLLFGIMNFLSDRKKVHDMPNNKSNPLKKSAIKMSVGV